MPRPLDRRPALLAPSPHPADAESEAPSTTAWPAPPIPTTLRLTHLHLTNALAPIAARRSGRREIYPSRARLGPSLFVKDINTARVEVGVWRRRWGGDGGAIRAETMCDTRDSEGLDV
ncbi:hypothetical protein B0H16DRAFT_1738236 [Mycena metata]|uniref:Uncharacterized protein n=1 Tax=Mycena metata TaxID=1033252 RepID=A0AAD7MKM3_9AGAR|nr:hypothetical protein B0H16DRAFT_1738236 [Mycena metata]